MRYINLKKASYNLYEREAKIEKVAERLIKIAAEDEAYGIGGKEDKVLFIPKPHNRKWGHYSECKRIKPYNHVLTEVYHIEPKVDDLEITMNEEFIYITSKRYDFRIGEPLVENGIIIEDAKLKEISNIIKYILVNGHKDLFVNKDHAEISFENENKQNCFLNDFYNKNIMMKNISENLFNDIIKYAKEIGLGLEVFNPTGEFSSGLINRKLILNSSQRWNCAEKMEDSEIYIEYEESDMKLGFRNFYYNINIDHYICKNGSLEDSNYIRSIAQMMAVSVYHLIKNGPGYIIKK